MKLKLKNISGNRHRSIRFPINNSSIEIVDKFISDPKYGNMFIYELPSVKSTNNVIVRNKYNNRTRNIYINEITRDLVVNGTYNDIMIDYYYKYLFLKFKYIKRSIK